MQGEGVAGVPEGCHSWFSRARQLQGIRAWRLNAKFFHKATAGIQIRYFSGGSCDLWSDRGKLSHKLFAANTPDIF